jgi:hypothetical protein
MGSMCRTHYHADRNTLHGMKGATTPGPGNYRLPSDFGYYEARKRSPSTSQGPRMSMTRSASQPVINGKRADNKETL